MEEHPALYVLLAVLFAQAGESQGYQVGIKPLYIGLGLIAQPAMRAREPGARLAISL